VLEKVDEAQLVKHLVPSILPVPLLVRILLGLSIPDAELPGATRKSWDRRDVLVAAEVKELEERHGSACGAEELGERRDKKGLTKVEEILQSGREGKSVLRRSMAERVASVHTTS
jgi:hypothetical protein